jgi:hypothetical protein
VVARVGWASPPEPRPGPERSEAEDTSGKPPVIGTLYVQEWALGNEPPKKLTTTIGDSEE